MTMKWPCRWKGYFLMIGALNQTVHFYKQSGSHLFQHFRGTRGSCHHCGQIRCYCLTARIVRMKNVYPEVVSEISTETIRISWWTWFWQQLHCFFLNIYLLLYEWLSWLDCEQIMMLQIYILSRFRAPWGEPGRGGGWAGNGSVGKAHHLPVAKQKELLHSREGVQWSCSHHGTLLCCLHSLHALLPGKRFTTSVHDLLDKTYEQKYLHLCSC